MKRILHIILLLMGVFVARPAAYAQTTYILEIDSVAALPDSIENGTTVTFFMQVSLGSPLFYQGNVFVEFEYGGNFYQADTTISQNFLTPNAPNQIQVVHGFSTDDDLNIGDNVVVVWPRLGNGTDPPQTVTNPYETTITLIEPNSISDLLEVKLPFVYPNPANSLIRFQFPSNIKVNSVRIMDMKGALVAECNGSEADISNLPNGIYLVAANTADGRQIYEKLLVAR